MKGLSKLLLAGLAGLVLSPIGNAAVYTATLSGSNENPATGSPGTGTAVVTLDTVAHRMRVQVNFSGLTSGTTASHIHCCATPPANAGVATTTPTFAGFPLGVTSGTYDATLDTSAASSWNPAFITANGGTPLAAESAFTVGLVTGKTYLNVHTSNFPGGEIRGFLALVPVTPVDGPATIPTLSTWGMAVAAGVLALLGVAALRRRRSA